MEADQADSLRKRLGGNRGGPGAPLRVIAVTSGKGGVGKTHLSANLAVLAAKAGRRVLVIDADLGLANVEIVYGIAPRFHLGHLVEGKASIEEVLAEGPHGVRVLPAGSGIQELTRLDEVRQFRLITALDPVEDAFDTVIVDSGAGIGDNVLFFVGAAQEALLVVSPEPTSLTDSYAAVKVLSRSAGVRRFDVVVNQAPTEAAARETFERLAGVTGRFLTVDVRYLGSLPRDENVHRAIMAQTPVVELFPQSPVSRALAGIADKLFDASPPRHLEGGLKFLWQRLFRESASR